MIVWLWRDKEDTMATIEWLVGLLVVGFLLVKFLTISQRGRERLRARVDAHAATLPAHKALYRELDIVGESYRQNALRELWRESSGGTLTAILIPENDNPHDKHAVRVEVSGLMVGYLSRETAKDYRDCMDAGRCAIPVHLVRGGPENTIGVFTGRKREG